VISCAFSNSLANSIRRDSIAGYSFHYNNNIIQYCRNKYWLVSQLTYIKSPPKIARIKMHAGAFFCDAVSGAREK
jgi:hypothetical protein